MLRLRTEAHFIRLTAPLSMTNSKVLQRLGYARDFRLRIQFVDLLLVALLNYTAAEL